MTSTTMIRSMVKTPRNSAAISVVETQAGLEPGLPGKPAIRPNNPSLIYFEGNNLVIRATSSRH